MAKWRSSLLLCLLWALLFLPGLFGPEFKGEEPRRALVAREMVQTGDFLLPRIAGEDYDKKPPLFNWAIVAAWWLGGEQNEGLARLPSALSMLLLAGVALWVLGRMFDERTGLLCALWVLLNAGVLDKARMAEIDAMYSALAGVALLLWWFSTRLGGWRAVVALVGTGLCLGLGMLAKGPVPLLWFVGVFVVAHGLASWRWRVVWRLGRVPLLVWPRRLGGDWGLAGLAWRALRVLLVWVPMLAVGVPWFWWLTQVRDGEEATGTWRDELQQRVLGGEGDGLDWGSSVSVFGEGLVNWLPMSLFLVPLLVPGVRRWLGLGMRRSRFAAWWGTALVVAYLPIALLPGGNGRYMMPLTLAAAVLVAVCLASDGAWRRLQWVRAVWRVALWVLLVLVGLFLAVAWVWAFGWYAAQISWGFLWWVVGVLCVWVALGLVRRLRLQQRWSPWLTATALVLSGGLGGYAFLADHALRGEDSLRDMAARIEAARQLESDLVLYRFGFEGDEGWMFYLQQPLDFWIDHEAVKPHFNSGLAVEMVMSERMWEKERRFLQNQLGAARSVRGFEQLGRDGVWLLVRFGPEQAQGLEGRGVSRRTWGSLARERARVLWEMGPQATVAAAWERTLEEEERQLRRQSGWFFTSSEEELESE